MTLKGDQPLTASSKSTLPTLDRVIYCNGKSIHLRNILYNSSHVPIIKSPFINSEESKQTQPTLRGRV